MPLPASPALVKSLSDPRLEQLTAFADGLAPESLLWLSGYAAGLAARPQAAPGTTTASHTEANPAPALTIVYGSQTGNARRVAEDLAAQLGSAGLPARIFRSDVYPIAELKHERFLQLVISTHGDGEPPEDSLDFVEYLLGPRAPKLPALNFAVFGLGDSSYPKFCETARLMDERLAQLDATRWQPLAQADLDFEAVAKPWLADTLALARRDLHAPVVKDNVRPLRVPTSPPAATRARPFAARVLANQRITGRGSDRDTRHIELALEGAGLDYEPGDALGVWAANPPALVDAVLRRLQLDGEETVTHEGQAHPLRTWLQAHRELTRLDRGFIERHALLSSDERLARLLEPANAAELRRSLGRRQLIDLIENSNAAWSATALVAALRPMAPRLYSIASSRKAVGEEAHLTIAHVDYEFDGARRWGAASHFLATRDTDATANVYVERNERFRLPADGSRDIIMIGAGTGVAPFRGFVQERAATGAGGRNWLFFGNPRFSSDFLYQLEWQRALKQGQLHRLDLAFSRDGAAKVYVQQRLRERAGELRGWLQEGANLYVCGNAEGMGRDVHATLQAILGEEALGRLQREGRYLRDLY